MSKLSRQNLICLSSSKISFRYLFILMFLPQLAMSQIIEEKLQWQGFPVKSERDAAAEVRKLDALGLQKQAEAAHKWTECRQFAERNILQYEDVKNWVLISGLRCANQEHAEKKKNEPLIKILQIAESVFVKSSQTASRDELLKSMVRLKFTLIQGLLSQHNPAVDSALKEIDSLVEIKDQLEKNDRALLYAFAGDCAQLQVQLKAAQFYYEQSLSENYRKEVSGKLNAIFFTLNEVPPDTTAGKNTEKNKLDKNSEKKDENLDVSINNYVSKEELSYEQRMRDSVLSNDLLQLIADGTEYLQRFPGGRRAKWSSDKILSIYQTLADGVLQKNSDEKNLTLQDKALSLMEKNAPTRMAVWAQSLHKRSDYVGSLRLSESALKYLADAEESENLLYMAGRSSQFLGKYDLAKKYFSEYIRTQSAGENLAECYFRLGLVLLRQKEYSSAVPVFEKVLTIKTKDRYELNARYWLIRALQKNNNPRAEEESGILIDKFPFSYYGLRLRAERKAQTKDAVQNAFVFEWPTSVDLPKPISGSIYLLKSQKKIWNRVKLLAKQGWWKEAVNELSQLPLPKSAESQVLWARELARIGLYPMAIRLINQAGDSDTSLKAWEVVQWSFPSVYKKMIQEQAAKLKLSPILIASLIRQESGFGLRAQSTSNAYGLMQLIGPTAQEVVGDLALKDVVLPEDIFQPQLNIQMGSFYLAKMIRVYRGHVPFGLAAYNAGAKRLQNFFYSRAEIKDLIDNPSSESWSEMWMDELPYYETSFYVKAILRNTILYSFFETTSKKVQLPAVLWSEMR